MSLSILHSKTLSDQNFTGGATPGIYLIPLIFSFYLNVAFRLLDLRSYYSHPILATMTALFIDTVSLPRLCAS